ncbi:hypothetical protein WJU16_00585 [Chitinophaga pollutisoli]|uniref:Uncharacterized protein n=1 Tax=Chitinophaga pollutisoli TaxID=3133966 RepID=A0ABZ2YP55_9BACT
METDPSTQLKIYLEEFIGRLAEDGITHVAISITGPLTLFQSQLPREVIAAGESMYVIQHYQPGTIIPADIMLRHDDAPS